MSSRVLKHNICISQISSEVFEIGKSAKDNK
jgi:hypothetical protein